MALLWALTIPLSIAVAEAALWLSLLLWCANWLRLELASAGSVPDSPARGPAGDVFSLIGTPLMAFWGVSVASALASRAPVESLWSLREVFLFAAPLVTYLAYRHPSMRRLGLQALGIGVLVAVGIGLSGTVLAVQRGEFPGLYRPDGTLGHYMTYAGALMVAIPTLMVVRDGWAGILHRVIALGALVVVGLTMTRSAWIGCVVGLALWIGLRFVPGRSAGDEQPPRRAAYLVVLIIGIVVGGIVLLTLAGPEALYERGASIFSLDNPTNVDRLAMAATGLRMIQAHPLLGVGPGLMPRVYPAWRVDWAVKETNPHLHNDALHLAAERGLLGLAAWLWLVAALGVGAWRVLRHTGPFAEGGPESRAALAALGAFLTMGLFEYNFSDSEVLMVLLFAATLPFAASAGLALARDD